MNTDASPCIRCAVETADRFEYHRTAGGTTSYPMCGHCSEIMARNVDVMAARSAKRPEAEKLTLQKPK